MSIRHAIFGTPLEGPFPGARWAMFGMGCFWGAEKRFWQLEGVVSTAVGYAGGHTPDPTYEEVCRGDTGHAEVVRVAFDPRTIDYARLLAVFWEGHDPTQGMRQGADVGPQYRSLIFTFDDEQRALAERTRARYGEVLRAAGYGPITTQILPAGRFTLAEEYHQQYLAKNPTGTCGAGGTGLACPTGL